VPNLWQAIPFYLTTLGYLVLGVWVIVNRKSRVQQLYGALCIATCFWQGIWAFLFSSINDSTLYLALRVCYTGIVFVPPIFFHFIAEFTHESGRRRFLTASYILSPFLALSVWKEGWFLSGFYHYSWGLAAHAAGLHAVFAAIVSVIVLRTLFMLSRMQMDEQESVLRRRQTRLVKLATLVYCGGALDLVSNYGVPLFPLSFIFSGIAILIFGYAMFRYEFLSLGTPRETEEDRSRREAASAEMRQLGMVAAFPLVSQGELMGYLLLGEKKSEEVYSKEDLLLLRIVANQAALAYQRVRYLEMVVNGARTEMLGEIAGGFAHELKTPLANISLPAELSLMDLTDLEQGKRTVFEVLPDLKQRMREIMKQAFKASDKIEAIRQFSKPGQIRLEAVDLSSVFHGSLAVLDHLLHKLGTSVNMAMPERLPAVRGDPKQLEIVFVNLIKNAAEAMAETSTPALARRLDVRAREEGDWVLTHVKDS
jgi:signal transduction histidine kinase